jgi:Arc/MetJ family transcription regulator
MHTICYDAPYDEDDDVQMTARRTTLNLDSELVSQAREVLGTTTSTDTVHAALRDVVRRQRLRELAAQDFSSLGLDGLEQLRRPRTAAELDAS